MAWCMSTTPPRPSGWCRNCCPRPRARHSWPRCSKARSRCATSPPPVATARRRRWPRRGPTASPAAGTPTRRPPRPNRGCTRSTWTWPRCAPSSTGARFSPPGRCAAPSPRSSTTPRRVRWRANSMTQRWRCSTGSRPSAGSAPAASPRYGRPTAAATTSSSGPIRIAGRRPPASRCCASRAASRATARICVWPISSRPRARPTGSAASP